MPRKKTSLQDPADGLNAAQIAGAAGGLLLLVALVVAYRWWNWLPVVERSNLRYIQLTATALSSKQPQQLERVEEAVRQKFAAGEMTPPEQQQLLALIDQAKQGDWEGARRACFRLAAAQQHRQRAAVALDHFSAEHAHRH